MKWLEIAQTVAAGFLGFCIAMMLAHAGGLAALGADTISVALTAIATVGGALADLGARGQPVLGFSLYGGTLSKSLLSVSLGRANTLRCTGGNKDAAMKAMMMIPILALAACQTPAAKPQRTLTPDEIEARQVCNDEVARDVRYAGSESVFDACVEKFLYQRRRGWR